MSTIGDFIKERRLSKDWSKRTLAEKAGISHSEVHRIENGERENPSIKMLLAISEALSVPKEEMLRIAGYADNEGEVPLIEKVFPDLKTENNKKQRSWLSMVLLVVAGRMKTLTLMPSLTIWICF